MREIGRIAQQRVQIAHHGDDGPRLAVALVAVLNLHQGVYHFVDVAAVLGQKELAPHVVVVLFHNVMVARALFRSVPRLHRKVPRNGLVQNAFTRSGVHPDTEPELAQTPRKAITLRQK